MKARAFFRCCTVVLGVAAAHAAIIVAAARPALASPPWDPPSVTIHYGDLDISRPQGARALHRRLSTGAAAVCGNLQGRDPPSQRRFARCYRTALDAALSDVYKVAGNSGR